jgi:hypothetical protein
MKKTWKVLYWVGLAVILIIVICNGWGHPERWKHNLWACLSVFVWMAIHFLAGEYMRLNDPKAHTIIMRTFFRSLDQINYFFGPYDLCEICHDQRSDNICIGCERRICYQCTTGYYVDGDLCTICRASITPEEEAEDQRDQAELDAEDEA